MTISQKFADAIKKYNDTLYRSGVSNPDLIMARSGNLTVEYAPFDHFATDAELAIVGLTPGRVQAANALTSLKRELARGAPLDRALAIAKQTASFSGPMRANLIAMLDEVGLPEVFGRQSSSAFFDESEQLVHFTSSLRYPVYVAGENYSGNTSPLRHPLLRKMIETHLAEEAAALPRAVWVPLGKHAEAALLHLADGGVLDRSKVLTGLPHPSGANAERIAYFVGRKSRDQLSTKTNPDLIDDAKTQVLSQISGLRRNATSSRTA